MIKVLQIRETPESKFAGVDANCQALIELFSGDEDVHLLPTVDYKRYHIPFLNQFFLSPKEIRDSLVKYKPDVVHIHGATTFTLPIAIREAKKLQLPIAVSTHFHPFTTLRRPLAGKLYFYLVLKKCLRIVDAVFTINNEDTGILSRFNKNTIKIPHWSKFTKPTSIYEKKKNQILFVGRLIGINKGAEHLFHLPEGKYKIICVGLGERELRSDMEHRVNISNEELSRLYRESSLLVVPSRYEAFSYVTLEALYNQTPVVISDRVRIADYLDGLEGISVFKYGDYDAFEKAVDSTIGKEVNLDAVDSIFSSQRIKEVYKKEYMELAELYTRRT